MLKEVRLAYRHPDCWMIESTERHPTLGLVLSSFSWVEDDVHVDLMARAPGIATVEAAADEWRRDPRIRKVVESYKGPRGSRFHVTYSRRHSVYPQIVQETPLSLGTVTVTAGVEFYNLLGEAEDVEGLVAILNRHGTARVHSVRNPDEGLAGARTSTVTPLAEALTEKQFEAIVLAHTNGYYQWPRGLSASALAERAGVSSAAFLDHLRRAEAKAVSAVMENLTATAPARVLSIRAKADAGPPAGED